MGRCRERQVKTLRRGKKVGSQRVMLRERERGGRERDGVNNELREGESGNGF